MPKREKRFVDENAVPGPVLRGDDQTLVPAKAMPSKLFFTETLTRDISVSDCILDLIDNSVHSLITSINLDVTEHFFTGTKPGHTNANVTITYDGGKFTLDDDCGGISIQDAREHVFRFGAPVKGTQHTGLGVYGIGMKRAFFKIGKQISISSHTTEEEFKIDIDVATWQKTDVWDFPFTYARSAKSRRGGTTIEVSNLHPTVRDQFASQGFNGLLVDKISVAFALFLKAGLMITSKGRAATTDLPELAEAKNLRLVRHMFSKNGVDVLILAGTSPATDRTPRGWYIFCNGRLVLDADKTNRTGWGVDSHPNFHSKFNHFLGYVFFRSNDPWKLPWTTTKEGVDRESPVYQAALAEMRLLSRPVLDFLSNLYPDTIRESEPEHALFRTARAVAPHTVAARRNSRFEAIVKKQSGDEFVSIQYRRPKKKLDRVTQSLGRSKMLASAIGEYTFDWGGPLG